MSRNRILASDVEPIDANARPSRSLCGHFRKRKLIWMLVLTIGIAVGISVPIVIIKLNKTQPQNVSAAEFTTEESVVATNDEQSTVKLITMIELRTTTRGEPLPIVSNGKPMKWKQDGSTVAGGNGRGSKLNQLDEPSAIHVDDEQSVYVTDTDNHRVIKWRSGATHGEVVAGGNGPGSELNKLKYPIDGIADKKRNAVIVCDHRNMRVMSWSRQNTNDQRILISFIVCSSLAIGTNGDLYVCDWGKKEIRRWAEGDTVGILVAGGSGSNQLAQPTNIFVDVHESVYIMDKKSRRIMKWMKGASVGIQVVPVIDRNGSSTTPLIPHGMAVDHIGHVYTTDPTRHYVTRWSLDEPEGTTVVGGEDGKTPDRLSHPDGLSFDQHGNLYVVDFQNNRVQKFAVDPD